MQQYWARTAGLYRYVPVREFAQAYAHSRAGEDQARALQQDFRPYGNADSALAWTKHALTGDASQCQQCGLFLSARLPELSGCDCDCL